MARGTVRCGLPPLFFCRKTFRCLRRENVDTSQITGGFDAIYQVIAAIVSSTGTILSVGGDLFEVGARPSIHKMVGHSPLHLNESEVV